MANGGREDVGFDTRVFDRREPKGLTGGCGDVVVEWCNEAMIMMMMMMIMTLQYMQIFDSWNADLKSIMLLLMCINRSDVSLFHH